MHEASIICHSYTFLYPLSQWMHTLFCTQQWSNPKVHLPEWKEAQDIDSTSRSMWYKSSGLDLGCRICMDLVIQQVKDMLLEIKDDTESVWHVDVSQSWLIVLLSAQDHDCRCPISFNKKVAIMHIIKCEWLGEKKTQLWLQKQLLLGLKTLHEMYDHVWQIMVCWSTPVNWDDGLFLFLFAPS